MLSHKKDCIQAYQSQIAQIYLKKFMFPFFDIIATLNVCNLYKNFQKSLKKNRVFQLREELY